jgi:hypothetical protein
MRLINLKTIIRNRSVKASLFPLPPSPRREGGKQKCEMDLSPSLLGEGFRERKNKKHRESQRIMLNVIFYHYGKDNFKLKLQFPGPEERL